MVRITITLNDQERICLKLLAEKEFRDPRAQAAFIIHKELERCGLATVSDPPAIKACADETTPAEKQPGAA